jgi:hypothetical protein
VNKFSYFLNLHVINVLLYGMKPRKHIHVKYCWQTYFPHKVVHHAVFCKYYAELAKPFFFCLTLGQTVSGVLSDPWSLCLSHHFLPPNEELEIAPPKMKVKGYMYPQMKKPVGMLIFPRGEYDTRG